MAAAGPETALPPGSTIAILGGGQLGRMLGIAAAQLGFKCRVFADDMHAPAFDVAEGTFGPFDDLDALRTFAEGADVLTYEFENVPTLAAESLSELTIVRPNPAALAVAQDRLIEKQFMLDRGIPVTKFAAIDGPDDIAKPLAAFGGTGLLKTRRFGYDGKGQRLISTGSDPQSAWADIGGEPAILEARVPFDYEVSVILVRDVAGRTSAYDVPRNEHRDGILRRSVVPCGLDAKTQAEAIAIAARIAEDLDYIGVLAVELFVLPDTGGRIEERLFVNEIAPRVHNSGHWTMDACPADQFENHIRAIAGWPLAATERFVDIEMINIIGDEIGQWREIASNPDCRLHIYGKNEARPGRKMGHINRVLTRSS